VQSLSSSTENAKNRLAIQFEKIQEKLIEFEALSEKISRGMA